MTGPFKVLLAMLSLIISFVQIPYFPHFWIISSFIVFAVTVTIEFTGYGVSHIYKRSDYEEVGATLLIMIFAALVSLIWPYWIFTRIIEYENDMPFAKKRLLVKLKNCCI